MRKFVILAICSIILLSGCSKNTNQEHYNTIIQIEASPTSTVNTTPSISPSLSAPTPASTPKGSLSGRTIFIDPGHQAIVNMQLELIAPNTDIKKEKMSYGTTGVVTKKPEYKLNLEVSLMLKSALELKGAKVIMSRETDDVDISNIERARLANNSGAELVIRIHADGIENSSVKGMSVLAPSAKYLNNQEIINKSKLVAEQVLKYTIQSTNAISRGIAFRDDITGFNWSEIPVILLEMGFMTNEQEDTQLSTVEYQKKVVFGILKGVEVYFDENNKIMNK